MLVFISWSKRSSRQVAEALRAFIEDVIYTAKPWVSTQDMVSGVAWFQEIGERLHEARIGVICVTPENQGEPWLLFEAGALAKNITASGIKGDLDVQRSYACPYVFGMGLGELTGPLHYLQARAADRDGTRALIETINLVLGDDGLAPERLARNFDKWWDDFEEKLAKIQRPVVGAHPFLGPTPTAAHPSETKLSLSHSDGPPFRDVGYHPTDADLIYRMKVAAASDTGIRGVKVVVSACEPSGPFQFGTPFRVMHEGPIFNLDAGEEKFPELFDVWVKQRDDVLVQPAHGFPVPKREAGTGVYAVTVRATGEGTAPCVKNFRVTIQNDPVNPVMIEAL